MVINIIKKICGLICFFFGLIRKLKIILLFVILKVELWFMLKMEINFGNKWILRFWVMWYIKSISFICMIINVMLKFLIFLEIVYEKLLKCKLIMIYFV